jgi:hypothetical protein
MHRHFGGNTLGINVKLCVRCGERPEHVALSGKSKGKGRSWCSPCLNKANYVTKNESPEKYLRDRRNNHLKKKYGITLDEYDFMLDTQQHKCASCGSVESGVSNGGLVIDHDHLTGFTRGLLCGHCNIALGHVKDDINRLNGLIDYLKKWSTA